MARKIDPRIIRIGFSRSWSSNWIAKKDYPYFLQEDFLIRDYLADKLSKASVESVEIERRPTNPDVAIKIKSAKPGIIIGRSGAGIETLKKDLHSKIFEIRKKNKKDNKFNINLSVIEVRKPTASASIMARNIADDLEKRLPVRSVLKRTLKQIMLNKEVDGAKVFAGGRLNGAEMSRKEWLAEGRIPSSTLRAVIDYGTARAQCTYGVIGIKVWIYKPSDKQIT